MDNYFYIYNLKQSEFFIKEGLEVLEIGVRNGKVYHKFLRDEQAEKIFSKWCNGVSD